MTVKYLAYMKQGKESVAVMNNQLNRFVSCMMSVFIKLIASNSLILIFNQVYSIVPDEDPCNESKYRMLK